ncbi:uncharacterized protein MICPUCDRAFT_55740 [Micromonas pusilla CCMP1545]|uniref:Large ribosomal subunit protein mL53 n=1 Tax=Micromonas pusilla (strain CCMP1545) TaxID=564608 RepID=C1MLJ9_MICPC|nr:uncharacterized protein MICPUCDRAFT_55740 [Micromonas pusilla CCMP1545]EEH59556.1 hypothetical protein MICPUCDRAFT_55740 [Micromonas pusilla CCMP1545]|eukprot:XP_003056180.1 hypothetical protein MICPUCDRAFT_55740 [Micromonas pusilla CCMP1545]
MSLRQLVSIQFSATDPRSAAVREFLQRCLAPKARESNPDCIVFHNVRSDDCPPVVSVEFVNGFKDQFNCHKLTVSDIMSRICDISDTMNSEELLEKSGLKTSELNLRSFIK